MRRLRIMAGISLICSALFFVGCNTGKVVTESYIGKEFRTESGLIYTIRHAGDGKRAEIGDKVFVHYSGRLTNGEEFDNSYKRGKPFQFKLGEGQVIKGWEEGIALLNVGDSAVFTIPPHLGYGEKDQGNIPGNSTLIFDVTLVKAISPSKPMDVVGKPVQTTASGLQYIMLEENPKGTQAESGAIVEVHYSGYLDGSMKKFDSSVDRDRPIKFNLGTGQVIKGWDEGIALLKTGETARLIIPPDLAYGDQEKSSIPANSTLVFDVQLLDVTLPAKPFDIDGKEVKTTESGLQYVMVEENPEGTQPTAGQTVKVHYSGYLQDGSKFDSSVDRGQPFQFPLGQGRVIKGWDEGISMLKTGEKARFIIPPDLGYGANGYPPVIPANATLYFDVELIDIQ